MLTSCAVEIDDVCAAPKAGHPFVKDGLTPFGRIDRKPLPEIRLEPEILANNRTEAFFIHSGARHRRVEGGGR